MLKNKKLVSNRYAIIRGYKPSDPARDYRQAFEIARNYPKDIWTLVVKTGIRSFVFPYTVYVKEMYKR